MQSGPMFFFKGLGFRITYLYNTDERSSGQPSRLSSTRVLLRCELKGKVPTLFYNPGMEFQCGPGRPSEAGQASVRRGAPWPKTPKGHEGSVPQQAARRALPPGYPRLQPFPRHNLAEMADAFGKSGTTLPDMSPCMQMLRSP